MRLYATVQSERASKGQGGNYLNIEIMDEMKKVMWTVKVRRIGRTNSIRLEDWNGIEKGNDWQIVQEKGKGLFSEKELEEL